jgi:hypothetical protein
MGCCGIVKYQKSSQTAYNNVDQTYVETGTVITILGTNVLDSGCSIKTLPNGFRVTNKGLYRVSFDITETATSAGDSTVQIYRNGVALPCSLVTQYLAVGEATSVHTETTLEFEGCHCCGDIITLVVGGTEGVVNQVNANMTRLA